MGSLEVERKALPFVRTLKQNLPNSISKSLLEALRDFGEGNTETADLLPKVSELLRDHPDLLAGFNYFLPENLKLPLPTAADAVEIPTTSDPQPQLPLKRRREVQNDAVEFVNKIRKFSKDDQIYASFLRAITDFEVHGDILQVDKQISDLFKQNPDLYINFTWFTADDNCRSHRVRVSESARKLTTLEECEDQLYESDMLFHSLESTKKATEKLLQKENGNGDNNGGIINLQDYFSAMNLRCIERMYGEDYVDQIMELLQTHPTAAATILLRRLNQKLQDAGELRERIREKCNQTMRREHNPRSTMRR
ncbi:paired amphipathic helix protein Sin3-like 1 [Ipomoea triloba]|uniref:paired amphipathic helix protein Sin3-like 1 n=1 Tax=Ipomoea triloba TaxID=35885 RepID=UPI00125D6A9C|nr:paired amphipathic helix protein Sin3-like 1 [Ipomoea triloba]